MVEEDTAANRTAAMWLRFSHVLKPVLGAAAQMERVGRVHKEIGQRCSGLALAIPIRDSLVLLDQVGRCSWIFCVEIGGDTRCH